MILQQARRHAPGARATAGRPGLCLAVALLATSVANAAEPSTLIHGGGICTMNPRAPWAQAVVVRGRDIVHVGTLADARRHTDADTKEIDLRGGTCLPGFIDAHDHLAMGGITKVGVSVAGLQGREAICGRIAEWVAKQPAHAVLQGFGWLPGNFVEGSPRREWLDAITGDRPMVVISADAHDLWFNTAAMKEAGLAAETPDPEPGRQYYKRDAGGTPTGHAVEGAAAIPILEKLGRMGVAAAIASQEVTLTPAPSWGITAVMDAGIIVGQTSDAAEPIFRELVEKDRAGRLPVRFVGTVWTRSPHDDPRRIAAVLRDWNRRYASEHLRVSVCKMWSEGVLLTGGALLLEPYRSAPHSCGTMTFTPEAIDATIAAVEEAGFDMHIHAEGDATIRTLLDCFERAKARGRGEFRHAIAHNTLVHPDDVRRYAALGVIANGTPLWGTDYDGTYWDLYTAAIGPERIEERLFPYGDLVRSGAVVTFGADIPGVQVHEIPPLVQIAAALTRRRPGHPEDRPLVPRQRMPLLDALRAYTSAAAYQLRLDDRVGSLEPGKAADLVILGRDIFSEPPETIHTVPVVLTMMDGRVTHDAR